MNKRNKPTDAPAVGAQTPEQPAPSEWAAVAGVAVPVTVAIPCDLVDPNPEQPRQNFNEAELKELADSIVQHGLIQPIVVHPAGDRYILHDGERRWRACKLAGLAEIPAYIVPPGMDAQQLLLRAIVANDQRADLSPIERANGYQRLADEHGLGDSDIARQVGKSRSVVANTRRLLNLPEDRQQQVAAGDLNERQALALLPLYQLHPEIQARLSQTWHVREVLAKPDRYTSDSIRDKIREGLQYIAHRFNTFGPDEVIAVSGGVRHSQCTDCPFYIKVGEEMRCTDGQCHDHKEQSWLRNLLEQAKLQTGLEFADPGRNLGYNQKTEFYNSNLPILEHALACKCPNLVLRASPYAGSSVRPDGVSAHVHYICLHPGKGEKSCKCWQAVESDKTAGEKLHKVQVQQMKEQATATLMAELEKCGLPALKAMAPYVLGYGDRAKIKAATEAAQLAKMIAKFLVDRELWAGDPERCRQSWLEWFGRIGLPLDAPNAREVTDLDRRLARIEAWMADPPEETDPGQRIKTIRGNLTNLAKLAEDMARIEAPAEMVQRYDTAKQTLLIWLDQVERQADFAAEVGTIRVRLGVITAWLGNPSNSDAAKGLIFKVLMTNASNLAGDVYQLTYKRGETGELMDLLAEIEAAESQLRARYQKADGPAPADDVDQAEAEFQPEEVAA